MIKKIFPYKKICSLGLSVLLVLSLASPAYAEENGEAATGSAIEEIEESASEDNSEAEVVSEGEASEEVVTEEVPEEGLPDRTPGSGDFPEADGIEVQTEDITAEACPSGGDTEIETETAETEESEGIAVNLADSDSQIICSGTCGRDVPENMVWELDASNQLHIAGDGAMASYASASETPWQAYADRISVVILGNPDGSGVPTVIGDYVFASCSRLQSLKIMNMEDTLTVGQYAFSGCKMLTELPFSQLVAFGEGAFKGCSALETADLSEDVTDLASYLFYNCTSLGSVTLPSGLTSIPFYAFDGCSALSAIELPETIEELGAYAFYKCSSLETISIPSGLTEIPLCAFSYCDKLTQVDLPYGVKTIGINAFAYDKNLVITVPASVTSLSGNAFSGVLTICGYEGSRAIEYAITNKQNYELLTLAHREDNILSSGTLADKALVWKYWEDGTLNISGSGGMEDYSSASEAPWQEYVSMLSTVILGEEDGTGVPTAIGDYAFASCSRLQFVRITNTEASLSVGQYAFYGCKRLTELPFSQLVAFGEGAFKGCSALETADLSENVTALASYLFYNCTSLRSVTLPSGLTSIPFHAFDGCSALSAIELPETIEELGAYAFYKCSSLEAISIPSGLTEIPLCAFSNCDKLTQVDLPYGVKTLGIKAFGNIKDLVIFIPASVTFIYTEVFSSSVTICGYEGSYAIQYAIDNGLSYEERKYLEIGTLHWGTDQNIYRINEDGQTCSLVRYTVADEIVELGDDVELYYREIEEDELDETDNEDPAETASLLTAAAAEADETSDQASDELGALAADDDSDIDISTGDEGCIPFTVTKVESEAFKNDKVRENMRVLVINKDLTIAAGTFAACPALEEVQYDHLTEISESLFADCRLLTSVIPKKQHDGTAIGEGFIGKVCQNAFLNCESLKTFTTTNEDCIFDDCFVSCPSEMVITIGVFSYLGSVSSCRVEFPEEVTCSCDEMAQLVTAVTVENGQVTEGIFKGIRLSNDAGSSLSGLLTLAYYADQEGTDEKTVQDLETEKPYYVMATAFTPAGSQNKWQVDGLPLPLTITKIKRSLTLSDKTITYDGKVQSLTAAGSGASEETITYHYYSDEACETEIEEACGLGVIDAGTYYVKACLEATETAEGTESNVARLTINKAATVIGVSNATKTYSSKGYSVSYKPKGSDQIVTFSWKKDGNQAGYCQTNAIKLYEVGTYKITIKVSAGKNYTAQKKTVTVKISRIAQSLTVSPTAKTLKVSSLKKKAASFKIIVKGARTKITYTPSGKAAKYITVTKAGKVTVKKGTPKGTYKIKVAAAKTAVYAAASKTVTITVK